MLLIKEDLYPLYLVYLKDMKLNEQKEKLLSISENFFQQFVNKYKKEPLFREKNDLVFRKLIREQKLKNLLQNHDTENEPADK